MTLTPSVQITALVVILRRTTDPGFLQEHARSKSMELRQAVASNPNTPRSVLQELGHDPTDVVRNAVAGNPQTPSETVEYLGRTNGSTLYLAVQNPRASAALLRFTWEHRKTSAWMVWRVAMHPNTPVDILQAIAELDDQPHPIPEALLNNPNTPVHVKAYVALRRVG